MRITSFSLFLIVGATVFVAILTGLLVFSQYVKADKPPILWILKNSPEAKSSDEKSSPASVRESDIRIATRFLNDNRSKDFVTFVLFDGETHIAVRNKSEGFERRGSDDFTWRGKLKEKNFEGDVVLTVKDGYMTGLIYGPDAVYEIIAKGDRQILIQLDQSLFPECGGEIKPPFDDELNPQANMGAVEDSGDRIDVLVVYTNAVKNAVGGDSQAQALAQSAVDISNTAYRNSKVRQRLRLVHSAETDLTEANSLSQLRADTQTQALRDTHNADMVAMLVNSLGGCGIGYVMTNVGNGFASSAYSITLRTCAVGNLTFAHELGHNMGSTHDPVNGGNAAFSYSYGHFVSGSYRTVMSYSSECTGGCTRVPQFSNPSVVFNNVATGIQNERDNARSLENTSDTVSNFRYSGSSIRLDNYSEDAFVPRNISRTLNWSTNGVPGHVRIEYSTDEGTNWQTLIASTPNDGSQVMNVNTRPTRRFRLRVSSENAAAISDSSAKNLWIK